MPSPGGVAGGRREEPPPRVVSSPGGAAGGWREKHSSPLAPSPEERLVELCLSCTSPIRFARLSACSARRHRGAPPAPIPFSSATPSPGLLHGWSRKRGRGQRHHGWRRRNSREQHSSPPHAAPSLGGVAGGRREEPPPRVEPSPGGAAGGRREQHNPPLVPSPGGAIGGALPVLHVSDAFCQTAWPPPPIVTEQLRKEDYNVGLPGNRPEQRCWCDLNIAEVLDRWRSELLASIVHGGWHTNTLTRGFYFA